MLSASQDDTDDGEDSHTGTLIYDFDTTLDLPYDAQGGCSIHKVLSRPLGDPVAATSSGRVVPYLIVGRSRF